MKFSLRTKLSFSYAMVALLTVAIISIISNLFLQSQFADYIMKKQEAKNNEIVNSVSQQYDKETGSFNLNNIENVGVNALGQGMIVKVTDISSNIIWDATIHNFGLCNQMIENISKNMLRQYPNFNGKYEEKVYPVKVNFIDVGTVTIGYYGPFYFNENDAAFINTLNRMLITVAAISLVLAFILGALMARRLTNPITKVIAAAEKISKGDYNNRIEKGSSTKELDKLILAINNLAAELESQETLRKRLTSDVAHELRTPLATLQSHMEAMIDGVWNADKERLVSCLEEIIRINKMVGDLTKLEKYEGENQTLDKSEFDIKELVLKVTRNFEADYKNKGVKLEIKGDSQIVYADSDKISQVIINLLSNALKYTPEGGKVKINISEEDENTILHIKDTGEGIPEDDLPYIFERFYRSDKSRTRLSGGSGIGLAIVKAIIDMHGGNITVKSEVNKGTEFKIVLPKK